MLIPWRRFSCDEMELFEFSTDPAENLKGGIRTHLERLLIRRYLTGYGMVVGRESGLPVWCFSTDEHSLLIEFHIRKE